VLLAVKLLATLLEYACPAWYSLFKPHGTQSNALGSIQRRAMRIIFVNNDFVMTVILAGQDMLESWRVQLIDFRRSVLCEVSWLHYLLRDKRNSSVTDRLRHAKTFKLPPARTNIFQNSFLPYCLQNYD